MRPIGPLSDRLFGGEIPRRIGATPVPSLTLASSASTMPGQLVTPAGFRAGLPNRAAARARGLNPRTGPR